jgi:hypothetical protein
MMVDDANIPNLIRVRFLFVTTATKKKNTQSDSGSIPTATKKPIMHARRAGGRSVRRGG